jgi:predicted O-methyltransferase YrrM
MQKTGRDFQMYTLAAPQVVCVLDRIFTQSKENERFTPKQLERLSELMKSKTGYRELYTMAKNMAIPISRKTGSLLYMLSRSTRARTMLEFGTSFGVSTIHLAAALRDNGGGKIITTEFESSKVLKARQNLTDAGLADLVEIREGDALETLRHNLPDHLDLVFLDGAKPLYLDILQLIEPHLSPGTLVIGDDVDHCPEFVEHLRLNSDRYLSVPLSEDLEISMRLG